MRPMKPVPVKYIASKRTSNFAIAQPSAKK